MVILIQRQLLKFKVLLNIIIRELENFLEQSLKTRLTATSYLNQLEEIGLLESEKLGREKLYKNIIIIGKLKLKYDNIRQVGYEMLSYQ